MSCSGLSTTEGGDVTTSRYAIMTKFSEDALQLEKPASNVSGSSDDSEEEMDVFREDGKRKKPLKPWL